MTKDKELIRLPVPDHLEPKNSGRTLAISVRGYFYSLYNAANGAFREMLASVENRDAITGNRLFDRHVAVSMIKKAAEKADDAVTMDAKDGDIYRVIVNLMRENGLSLKERRSQYSQLTHQAPAE